MSASKQWQLPVLLNSRSFGGFWETISICSRAETASTASKTALMSAQHSLCLLSAHSTLNFQRFHWWWWWWWWWVILSCPVLSTCLRLMAYEHSQHVENPRSVLCWLRARSRDALILITQASVTTVWALKRQWHKLLLPLLSAISNRHDNSYNIVH